MISAIILVIAAIMSAVMDVIEHKFQLSIFKGKHKFWEKGGKHLPFTEFPADGWHVAKSILIACIPMIAYFYEPTFSEWYFEVPFILIVSCVLWIIPFNIFYNKVLLKSNK